MLFTYILLATWKNYCISAYVAAGKFHPKSSQNSGSGKYIYVYIYVYSHPQTDCFVLSEHFSVARHVGLSKPGSKPSNFTLDLVSDYIYIYIYIICK